jgi:hypothetical protein
VGRAHEIFLRRYATSPIHVPRLERLLAVYDEEGDEGFAARFIEWDRGCPNGEAARIVAEILSAGDGSGSIARLSDDAVKGAIRWMSEPSTLPVAERADALRAALTSADPRERAELVALLEASLS